MKQVQRFIMHAVIGCAVLCMSGCLPTREFMGNEVPQAARNEPAWKTIKEYVRSLVLYEGFETAACFDVLWMSDRMRQMYSSLHASKVGYNQQEHEGLLLRELEENERLIVMYVLEEVHDPNHVSMSEETSLWSLYLQTKTGFRIQPLSVKEVGSELAPEIRLMFGHRATPTKKAHRVIFPAKDIAGRRYFTKGEKLTLVIASSHIRGQRSWDVPAPLKTDVALAGARHTKPSGVLGTLKAWGISEKDDDFFW